MSGAVAWGLFALALVRQAGEGSGQPARASEDELFGAPSEAPPAAGRAATDEAPPEDPLKIGGTFYSRALVQTAQGAGLADARLSAPSLVDGYFDARPNERLRGMLVARLRYDATSDESPGPALLRGPLGGGTGTTANPSVLLDQLWLRFDIAQTLFVTAGKQHVKWGTARFWNPTDFLSPQRKEPLALFDERTGATMLKLHLPWEERGWNFYAIGLLDHAAPASTLGKVGGALRAEVVLGETELGADAVFERGRKARFGFDVSSGLGPLDVYAEVAVQRGTDGPLWRRVAQPDPALGALGLFESYTPDDVSAAMSGGLTWTFAYSDSDTLTLGAEYFFNPRGYDDPALYPWLLFQGSFQPFYVGRHYAGLFGLLPAPGGWEKTTFVLSTLGNLSDSSWVTRLDFIARVLTHLQVEAFGAVHYGTRGGELRFALDLPAQRIGEQDVPALSIPPPLFEVGAGLRIDL